VITNMDTDKTGRANDSGGRRRSLWKRPALITVLILLILLLCDHFVDGWNWPRGAFVVFGALIFCIGFTYQMVTRRKGALAYRAAVAIAFAAGFFLTWVNFVQMADATPFAAIYFGVPIVGVIGAAAARLRPKGMARALFVTALAQAMVLAAALIFLITRNPQVTSWTPPEWRGLGFNAFFDVLFAVSALLFQKAGRREFALGAP
jgi:protein-S-isoprenylcysteine O-methyltransferase Ste14